MQALKPTTTINCKLLKNIEGKDYMKNCPTIPINEETFDMSFWQNFKI